MAPGVFFVTAPGVQKLRFHFSREFFTVHLLREGKAATDNTDDADSKKESE
jgi:hypothetical protein